MSRRAPERIAICIATHEPRADLLSAQLESIRRQTHEDWVCVISDDASGPEGIRAIENSIGADDRFLLFRSTERLGVYRNFERALERAPRDARMIALADQDDRWHPRKLERLLDAIGGAWLIHSDARVVTPDGTLLAPTLWPAGRPVERMREMVVANAVTGAGALIRREAVELALPFPDVPGAAYHDHWLALVALAGGGIAYLNEPLWDYVQHAGAALGHGRTVGIGGAGARERLHRIRANGWPPSGWRALHEDVYGSRRAFAIALEERLGRGLPSRDRRALARLARADRTLASAPWLAARYLRGAILRRPGRGLELALLRAVLWRRLKRGGRRAG